jgi:thermosome
MAARIIAEAIKTTLGPRGMDKMLIDSLGDITITNDGAAILDEIEVEHPAAKMMVEVAKTQDDMVGDGTTTAVVLAGELLRKAEELLNQNVHPTVIVSGYRKAVSKAIETLNKIGIPVDLEDRKTLRQIAMTAMASKAVGGAKEHLAEIAIDAVKQIAEKRGDKWVADIDNVQIMKKEGKSIFDTQLVRGVVLDKEVVHPGMPKRIENAKIALVNVPLEVEKTEFNAEIRIRSPEQMKAFLDQETKILQDMVQKVKASGATVLFAQKGIDDMAQHFLAKEGILAARRVKESDMEKLAKATGGRIVTNLDDLKAKDLGYAKLVEERKIGDDKMTFIKDCKNPRAVAILIRGGAERIIEEAERSIHDALCVVRDVVEEPKAVAGGGAPEIEVARILKDYAETLPGREQLAVLSYAEALESIPETLAENAGLDPIDMISELRARHEKGEVWAGIDVLNGRTENMNKLEVLEPLSVKKQIIKSATEAATMILKIDDIVAAGKMKEPSPPKEPSKGEEESESSSEF